MKKISAIILLFVFYSLTACGQNEKSERVIFGDENLVANYLNLLAGKRVGIVANQSAVLPDGIHIVDTLLNSGINITSVFAPEHSFRGTKPAGKNFKNFIDLSTGIPVYSLYSKNRKPTRKMLQNVDVVLFDLQDVGARFYTYISTLFYVMQACSENDKPLIVLDRPNPLSGIMVDGPVLREKYKSFVGIVPLPVLHGMTVGEIAKLFSGENYISVKNKIDLTTIEIKNWKRNQLWSDYRNRWIPTSPNIPDFETAMVYPGTCFLEGTNISEGRGTEHPFLTIGAPFLNTKELIKMLNGFTIEGVRINPVKFTPKKIPGKSLNPKYEGIECSGIRISVTDKSKFKPVEFGVYLLYSIINIHKNKFIFKENYFDKLAGSNQLRKGLLEGKNPSQIIKGWKNELEKFKLIRNKYLLY